MNDFLPWLFSSRGFLPHGHCCLWQPGTLWLNDSPVAQVIRRRTIVGLEQRTVLIARDGIERPIEDSGAPITDGGALRSVVLVFRDATAQRADRRALLESEQRYRAAADEFTALADNVNQLVWMAKPDGVFRPFPTRVVPIKDERGNVTRWFGTNTDISEQRRAEAALREANRRKDVFLATLSHELRNPLAPIRNAASFLAKPSLSSADHERSRLIIVRQVRHMASFLDDLLDVSRITRPVFALEKQCVNLQALLAEALETARPLIDQKRHAVKFDWPEAPVEVEADPIRLVQVATNLLTNAAQYTDPEGLITFAAQRCGADLRLSVRDTGIGLAPDMLNAVFEMFSQVAPNKNRSEGGLGIGLALVKGLVELHGGRIEARSEGTECGSEFIVSLPGSCVAAPALDGSMAPQAGRAGGSPAKRVLIADDNYDGAESLAMLMEASGHEVYLAHTGVNALEMADTHRPHVAILDIGMPGLDGYQVAQQIRDRAWGLHMMLIALTGWEQEDDKRRAKRAGFDHHFTKPVDPVALDELLKTVWS